MGDDDKWLDGYAGQSAEELIALSSEYRNDSVVLAFEQALMEKSEQSGENSLSEHERTVLAVEALEREVNNGGYDQFFINASEYAPIVVSALRRIGCEEAATLTQEAIETLGLAGAVTADAVDEVMEQDNEGRDDKLGELDGRYYEVVGDLAGPLLEFIKVNRDDFVLQGKP